MGCTILFNHRLSADDLCCRAPSAKGLQTHMNACESYALTHDMIFNPHKSVMYFASRSYCYSMSLLWLCVTPNRHIFNHWCISVHTWVMTNMTTWISWDKLNHCISRCVLSSKNLWLTYSAKSYTKLQSAYNNTIRALSKIPCWVNVRQRQVECNVHTFEALMRRISFGFILRCINSCNSLVDTFFNWQVLVDWVLENPA